VHRGEALGEIGQDRLDLSWRPDYPSYVRGDQSIAIGSESEVLKRRSDQKRRFNRTTT
jgi:hypothetical protein